MIYIERFVSPQGDAGLNGASGDDGAPDGRGHRPLLHAVLMQMVSSPSNARATARMPPPRARRHCIGARADVADVATEHAPPRIRPVPSSFRPDLRVVWLCPMISLDSIMMSSVDGHRLLVSLKA